MGRDTVRTALAKLEEEGVLVSQGQGKRRRIVMAWESAMNRTIRVRIFLYEKRDRADIDNSSLLAELLGAGFDAGFEEKSLKDPGMDVERVAGYVKRNAADAWVVSAGSRAGLRHLLVELFRHSPPTGLIFQESPIFVAAPCHLASRGIVAPRDVSLVVADHDASFAWSDPIPSHIEWDYHPVVRRLVRWAGNVAQGKEDRRQSCTESKFVEGGTIGPVPGRSGG